MLENLRPKEKLKAVTDLFIEADNFWHHAHLNTAHWFNFYAGSQYSSKELEYLNSTGRAPIVIPVTHGQINQIFGAIEENRKLPRATAGSPNDAFAVEVWNMAYQRLSHITEEPRRQLDASKHQIVAGLGALEYDLEIDPFDPDHVTFSVNRLHPNAVFPDPASEADDFSDMNHVFTAKWLTRPEFESAYPKFAGKKARAIFKRLEGQTTIAGSDSLHGASHDNTADDRLVKMDDGSKRLPTPSRFFDKRKRQIRVIRLQHWAGITRKFVRQENGQFRLAIEGETFDDTNPPTIIHTREIRWIDFIDGEVLFDETDPLQINMFSIVPYVAYRNQTTGNWYGMMHLLEDMQRDVNKRYMQQARTLDSGPRPMVEKGALPAGGAQELANQMRTPAAPIVLEDGALTGNKLELMPAMTLPDGAGRLHETAIRNLGLITGVNVDASGEPRGIPEAAATAQLKFRQGLMALRDIHENFRWAQRQGMQILVRFVMSPLISARQLQRILSNDERYIVQEGVIIDARYVQQAQEATQQGQQPQPPSPAQVAIKDVRALEFNIEMVPADDTNAEGAMQLQLFMAEKQLGIPVPNKLIVERSTASPDERREWLLHIEQVEAQQAQQQEEQMQLLVKQEMAKLQLDQAELEERQRHNMQLEEAAVQKIITDTLVGLSKVGQKADSDEGRNITQVIIDAAKLEAAATPVPTQAPTNGA